jgi:hypothetical protein
MDFHEKQYTFARQFSGNALPQDVMHVRHDTQRVRERQREESLVQFSRANVLQDAENVPEPINDNNDDGNDTNTCRQLPVCVRVGRHHERGFVKADSKGCDRAIVGMCERYAVEQHHKRDCIHTCMRSTFWLRTYIVGVRFMSSGFFVGGTMTTGLPALPSRFWSFSALALSSKCSTHLTVSSCANTSASNKRSADLTVSMLRFDAMPDSGAVSAAGTTSSYGCRDGRTVTKARGVDTIVRSKVGHMRMSVTVEDGERQRDRVRPRGDRSTLL